MSHRKLSIQCLLSGIFFILFTYNCIAAENVPGEEWNSMSKESQLIYLLGFRNGYLDGKMGMGSKLIDIYRNEPKKMPPYIKGIVRMDKDPFFKFNLLAIHRVVCAIYKDHANTYIPHSLVIHISTDKLEGRPQNEIDKTLELYRSAYALLK